MARFRGPPVLGVDDFDETGLLPYVNDLIRLAASVKVARKLELLRTRTKHACDLIIAGYQQTLRNEGCPFVLAEHARGLEKLGIEFLKIPKDFWQKLEQRRTVPGHLPRDLRKTLERSLPPNLSYRVVQREAGLGSLGQQRFVAIAQFQGGCIAREAKRLVPAATAWLNGRKGSYQSLYQKTMNSAIARQIRIKGLMDRG